MLFFIFHNWTPLFCIFCKFKLCHLPQQSKYIQNLSHSNVYFKYYMGSLDPMYMHVATGKIFLPNISQTTKKTRVIRVLSQHIYLTQKIDIFSVAVIYWFFFLFTIRKLQSQQTTNKPTSEKSLNLRVRKRRNIMNKTKMESKTR